MVMCLRPGWWIPLTKGYYAQVDKEDWTRVSQFKWHVTERKSFRGEVTRCYARRNVRHPDGCWTSQYLHDFIMCREPGDTWQIDHRDGNGLNNRRENLRRATQSENNRNSHRHREGTVSGVRVYNDGRAWPYEARVSDPSLGHYANGSAKMRHLGYYATREEAAAVAAAFIAERDRHLKTEVT